MPIPDLPWMRTHTIRPVTELPPRKAEEKRAELRRKRTVELGGDHGR